MATVFFTRLLLNQSNNPTRRSVDYLFRRGRSNTADCRSWNMQIRLLGNILVLSLTLVSVLVVVKTFPATSESVVRQAVSLSRIDMRQRQATLAQASPCGNGHESGLPLPSGFAPANLSV